MLICVGSSLAYRPPFTSLFLLFLSRTLRWLVGTRTSLYSKPYKPFTISEVDHNGCPAAMEATHVVLCVFELFHSLLQAEA